MLESTCFQIGAYCDGSATPTPLMQDIYSKSLASMEDSVGPGYLPKDLIRT